MMALPCASIDLGNILVANLQVFPALSAYLAKGPDLSELRTNIQALCNQFKMSLLIGGSYRFADVRLVIVKGPICAKSGHRKIF
ncbi:hypothetical protein [Planctobacterium marinum]|uniref:hypothetical protein n=1 Tax=Planctobacterium marinum TaxID=1631968 RepID=UPI001E447825|nr:hypothetical protein [Planctobacterium marinum]MCC2605651.1 hypothetical protein [Planctobacterium marinum]